MTENVTNTAKNVPDESICINFKDNSVLSMLYGDQDKHLARLEKQLNLKIASRGNLVSITGHPRSVYIAESVLKSMYQKLQKGMDISLGEFEALIRMSSDTISRGDDYEPAPPPKPKSSFKEKEVPETIKADIKHQGEAHVAPEKIPFTAPVSDRPARGSSAAAAAESSPNRRPAGKNFSQEVAIKTLKKPITAYSHRQTDYIKALEENEVVFASGPAGTGKTYLAVAAAVKMFLDQQVDRIILCRPAVEAGEKIGFLPGDIKEKVDPYLRPLYDALYDMIPAEKVIRHMESGEIEIAPLAFMRGRTMRYSFVILDEAQNTTPSQMKMFLTRLGEGSHMAITGDLSQTDLPRDIKSGFRDAMDKLKDVPEISMIQFGDEDIVRHPLTVKIVQAYEKLDKKWE